jgi:hypothetical protein
VTADQEAEVKLLALNILAVLTDEQRDALCARLLGVELSMLKAWIARQKERNP